MSVLAEQKILSAQVQAQLKKEFQGLSRPVTLLFFTQKAQNENRAYADQLLTELAALSPKIKLEKYTLEQNPLLVRNYQIDKVPAIVIIAEKDSGIRFFGVPGGYEFSNLIAAVLDVSSGNVGLDSAVLTRLKKIKKPVHIQVLVTPTCPYCTKMVRWAHQFALVNVNIRADMVEVNEFPELAQRYQVVGVPLTVINEKIKRVGIISLEEFLESIEQASK